MHKESRQHPCDALSWTPASREQLPPTNFSINLRMPTGEVKPYFIPVEFFKAHPNEWQAWVANPGLHMEMWQRFGLWHSEWVWAWGSACTVGRGCKRPAGACARVFWFWVEIGSPPAARPPGPLL
jgi:hypothetical protein